VNSPHFDESDLRHPGDKYIFIASVVLNIGLMSAAVYLVANGSDWIKSHPFLGKWAEHLRTLAIFAILALPASVLVRNSRRGLIRQNSVRLSKSQFAQIYDLLDSQCRKLGLMAAPELYITNSAISGPAMAFSSWKRDYIVLGQSIVESDAKANGDVVAFIMGRELGRIRLGYTRLWKEALLTYVLKIPYLNIPITRVRTYSCDRYGAFLAPEGVRGLVIAACGRRLLPDVNLEDYIKQAEQRWGLWTRVAGAVAEKPPVLRRLKTLYQAGLLDLESDLRRFRRQGGTQDPVAPGNISRSTGTGTRK